MVIRSHDGILSRVSGLCGFCRLPTAAGAEGFITTAPTDRDKEHIDCTHISSLSCV